MAKSYKEILKGVKAKEERKPRTYQEILKSNDYDFGVDESYIDSFVQKSQDYIKSSVDDSKELNYNNSSSKYSGRQSDWSNLQTQAQAIRAFYNSNKDKMDEETYNSMMSYIDTFDKDSRTVLSHYGDTADYYSQWETEEDYKKALLALENDQNLLNFDTVAGQEELDRLSEILNKIESEANKRGKNAMPVQYQHLAYNDASKYLEGSGYNSLEELRDAVSKKSAHLTLAKRRQDKEQLKNTALNAEDFEQGSQYVSTNLDLDKQYGPLTNTEGMYDDFAYEYINATDEETRRRLKFAWNQANPGGSPNANPFRAFDLMSEDEKSIYNWYVSQEKQGKLEKGSAQKYYKSIEDTINQRQGAEIAEDLEGKPLLQLAQGIITGLDQWGSGTRNNFNTEDDYIAPSALQYASGMVREDLDNPWLQGGYDLITTTANMLPSIGMSAAITALTGGMGLAPAIAGQIGAGVGAVTLGASASGNAYQEMLNLGYDKGQARTYSVLTGISEAGLQYALGGIGKLSGGLTSKLTGKAIAGIAKGVNKASAQFAIKYGAKFLGNMASEGFEEFLQEILNPYFKSLATGEKPEDIDWEQAVYSGMLGALSAGFLEGIGSVGTTVSNISDARAIKKDGKVETLKKVGSTFSADSVAYKIADKVTDKTGAFKLAMLLHDVKADLSTQNQQDITNALVKKGMDKNSAESITKWLSKAVDGETFSKAQQIALEENPIISKVFAQFIDSNSTINQRKQGLTDIYVADAISKLQNATVEKTLGAIANEIIAKEKNATKSVEESVSTEIKVDAEKGVSPQRIDSIDNGQIMVATDDGAVQDVSEVTTKTQQESDLLRGVVYFVQTANSLGIDVDASSANSVMHYYDPNSGIDIDTYIKGATDAVKYGVVGQDKGSISNDSLYGKLTKSQQDYLYNIGRKIAEKTATKDGLKAKANLSKNGKVTRPKEKPNKTQEATIQMTEKLSEAGILKNNFHFFYSVPGKIEKNGKMVDARVFSEDVGIYKKGAYAPNGFYQHPNGDIYIDLNSGNSGQGLSAYTLAHELGHFVKKNNAQGFKILADFIANELGVDLEQAIALKLDTWKELGRTTLTYMDAYEDVICDALEPMFTDGNLAQKLVKYSKGKKGGRKLLKTLMEFFDQLIARIKRAYKNLPPDDLAAVAMKNRQEALEKASDLFAKALVETTEMVSTEAEATLAENGIVVDSATDSASLLSVRDVLDGDKKSKVAKSLAMRFGVTEAEAMNWLSAETSLASLILNPKYSAYLDYEADPDEVAIKTNSDYPQGTVDFSPICAKRREFTSVMNNILRLFPNHVFAATDLAKIRTIMQEEGMTIPCGICYVEDRRQLDTIVAQDFIDSLKLYREGSKTRPDGKPFNANQLKGLKLTDGDTYIPSVYELVSLEGRNKLKAKNPNMEAAWVKYNNARGMQSVRLLANEAEYKRQILDYSKSTVKSKNDKGGLRIYSFSDAEMFHLIDIIQVITDSATVGLALQGYTKVNEYAKAVKDTGEKLNRSLIPKGELGYHMEDGKVVLDYDTVEGIDINSKDFFDNKDNPNIGNITIGVSDVQIRAAMVSDFIDQIIPFHTGQSAEVLGEKGIATWTNYKDFQAEKDIATGKKSDHQINIYTEVLQVLEKEGKTITKRSFVEKFLQVCKENGLIPRFSQFLNTNENGEYVYTEGYHKFLVDFKTFAQTEIGEYLPQMPVKPIFDNAYITSLLEDYVKSQKVKDAEIAKSMPKVIERITNEIIKPSIVTNDSQYSFSLRTEAPPKNTEKAYKLMRLVDGKLYPLFIGNNEEVSVGTWYNADSPNLSQLKNLTPGTHLVDMETGKAITWDEYAEKYIPKKNGKLPRSKPNIDDVHWANDNGYRFMHIEEKAGGTSESRMLKQYGDTRAYYNWGVNGSSKTESGEGSASLYALRPGWHFGEVPSMHQIGYDGENGEKVRLDNQVWVEVEMSADIDYNAEAESNWGGDIPTHIPTDGYYKFATNPTQKKTKGGNTEADLTKANWYVAGAFKVNRILSDAEADSIVEKYNKDNGKNVPLDYRRNNGRVFNAESMSLENVDTVSHSDRDSEGVWFSERDFPIDANVESMVRSAVASAKDSMRELSTITSEQNNAINRLVNQTNDDSYRGKHTGGKHKFSNTMIKHALKEHGDFLREGLRAQLPINEKDIARHLSAIKDNKMPSNIKPTKTKRGNPSIVTSYEVNGYTLYAEEIIKSLSNNKPSDLIGHTMYKAPTLATAAALATSARALPKRQSIVLCEYNTPNSNNLSTANFVSDENGNPAELNYIVVNNTPKADTLLGGLIALSSSEKNFTDKSKAIQQGYVMCKKPFYISMDNRVFSNSDTDVSAKINELKKQGYDCFIFDKVVGDNYMVAVVNKSQIVKDEPTISHSDRDSEGNQLSKGQQEYFKDSKVRWGETLMPVYHGTRRRFTVFDPTEGYDENRVGALLWAAKDYEYAKDYSYSDEPIVMKGYLNITNMLDIGDIDSYSNYEDRLQEIADLVKLTPSELEAMVDYKRILIYDITSSKAFRDRIVELGYDGVVAWESGLQTFGFVDSNQFKDTANKNPTTDPDISFSDRDIQPITETEYKNLENHFGTTGNFKVAGYLLTNGKLLDFSGKHWGDTTSRMRQVDHREAQEVLNRGNNGINDMIDMIGNGNIRLMPEIGGINLAVYPNEKQRRVLSVYINYMLNTEGQIVIDYDSVGGDTVYSKTYGKTATSRQILNDIRNYFNGARQSELMSFHTTNDFSDRDIRLDSRTLLANALESTAQNETERDWLKRYKAEIKSINADLDKLAKINAEIKEISFTKDSDRSKLPALNNNKKTLEDRITRKDKYLLKIEASKPLKRILDQEKAKAKKDADARVREAIKAQKETAAETLRNTMNMYSERIKNQRDGRNKTEMKRKIRKVVGDLNKLLLKPTKERHIPEELRVAVAEALAVVNMDTVTADARVAQYNERIARETDPFIKESLIESRDRIIKQGENLAEKLGKLKDAYSMISADDSLKSMYDDVIFSKIESVQKKVGNTPLRNMSMAQLQEVYELYTMVLTSVRDSNKAFAENLKQTRTQLGSNTFGEIKDSHKARDHIKHEDIERFGWKNLKPMQAIKTIGSGTLQKLWNNILYGQEVFAQDFDEAVAFAKEMKEKHGYSNWDLDKQYSFESKSGKVMKLNLEQMMSLYAYSKRNQADDHIEKGGILLNESVVKVKDKLGRTVEIKVNDNNAHRLDKLQVGEIIETLEEVAPGAKAFVDEMQKYLSDTMGEKGNEVSMKMYGVRLFKETHYFPLKVSKDFMEAANAKLKGDVKIKNKGMTKSVVEHASQPIVLENFLDVWANHINEMAMYHGLVLPLEDFSRTLNYSFKADDEANVDAESVRTVLRSIFGESADNYLNELMKAINGGVLHDSSSEFADRMISKFKKAKVMASLSVIVQQPTAIIRAMGIIEPKYFTTQNFQHKQTWEELKKYCPTAIIKEVGSFDTNMGRTITDLIKEDRTLTDKVSDFLGKAPAYMDEMGWNMIWRALKNKISTEQNLSGEELLKECGKQMTLIINETQVYDSVMARSELMRSKSTFTKMATSFMAEPTTIANMIYGAVLDFKRGKKGMAKRTVAATISSIVINGLISSLVYALRDDDEEKTLLEKYMSSATTEILDGLNPLTYIPYIKDAYSLFQGYDIERTDMALIGDVVDALDKFSKLFDPESYEDIGEGEIAKHIYNNSVPMLTAICDMFGLPVGNVLRDAEAILVYDNLSMSKSSGVGIGLAIKEGWLNSSPKIIQNIFGDDKYQKLYLIANKGDTTYVKNEVSDMIAEKKESGKTDKEAKSAVRQSFISRYREEYIKGNATERNNIRKLLYATGLWSSLTELDELLAKWRKEATK